MMKKIIFLFCLIIFSITSSHLSIPNQPAYAQEGGNYTCSWQTWSSSCQITINCEDGYSPGVCPSRDICEAECQPPSNCVYPCVGDILPQNHYVCKEGPYGCQFDRDNCDENHYAGACVISGQCVTSPRPCEEASTNICDLNTYVSTYGGCGPALCQCPDPYECRQSGPGQWRCEIPPALPGTGCDDQNAIPTAIGCINVKSPEGFVSNILSLAIGIAGGIAMLLIIFGGIQVLTSGGSPEKIQAGKELITSAIAGLLLIVFSVFILRIIGVEVLKIFE